MFRVHQPPVRVEHNPTQGSIGTLKYAMVVRGFREEQQKLISFLRDELRKRNERLYYIMGAGRTIFDWKKREYKVVGVRTIVQTTIEPKEARKLAGKIAREHELKVTIEVPYYVH